MYASKLTTSRLPGPTRTSSTLSTAALYTAPLRTGPILCASLSSKFQSLFSAFPYLTFYPTISTAYISRTSHPNDSLLTTRRFLEPGGYAEFTDIDVSLQSPDKSVGEGSPLHQFNSTAVRLSSEAGMDPNPGHQLEGWLKDVGFVDVKVKTCPLPMGTWAKDKHLKEVGAWMYLQTTEGLESFVYYAFSVQLGWSKEEVDVLCAKVRSQLKNPRVHGMLQM